MWTDKALELLITPAIDLMEYLGFRKARVSIMTGVRPPHEDYRETWARYTTGERAYLSLFLCATSNKKSREATWILCRGNAPLFDKVWKDLCSARNSYGRDIVNITPPRLQRVLQAAQKQPQLRRSSGWSPEDVAAEYFDVIGAPASPRTKKPILPMLREIEGAAGPARKVSVEEYLATRRKPTYSGVKLEFDKESEHWAQEKLEKTDEIYDGTAPDETI